MTPAPTVSFLLPILLIVGTSHGLDTSVAAEPAAALPTLTLREYLNENGLSCCIDVITRNSGWFQTGGALDSISDVSFLTEEVIDVLPMPTLKRNILKQLSSQERELSSRIRREKLRMASERFSFLWATLESEHLFRTTLL